MKLNYKNETIIIIIIIANIYAFCYDAKLTKILIFHQIIFFQINLDIVKLLTEYWIVEKLIF